MIASAAERRRWWTGSGSVWTGATTIESPVWTPSGSTFSIEQTAMQVSSASRMTSYSISCQPTRQRSIMTWWIGLRRRPGPGPLPVGRLGLDDAAAGAAEREGGPDDRRQADLLRGPSRAAASRASSVSPSTIAARRVRLADPVEQVAEQLAVLGHLDRLQRRADQPDVVPLEDAGLGQRHGQVEPGLAAEPGEQPLRPLFGDDLLDGLDGERLEVDGVGDLGVGHDRGRVRVDQDRPHALGAKRPAGLRAGVVELGRLADHDRAGADDQRAPGLGPLGARRRGVAGTGIDGAAGRGEPLAVAASAPSYKKATGLEGSVVQLQNHAPPSRPLWTGTPASQDRPQRLSRRIAGRWAPLRSQSSAAGLETDRSMATNGCPQAGAPDLRLCATNRRQVRRLDAQILDVA